jgi:hypothetical protein
VTAEEIDIFPSQSINKLIILQGKSKAMKTLAIIGKDLSMNGSAKTHT